MDLHNILLADSEVSNLKALEETLRYDYNIFTAISSDGAFVIMEENDIPLVIANYHMSGIDGEEFLERIRQENPDVVCIVIAAYSDEDLLLDAINEGYIYGYITKPWEPEEIKATVREAMQTHEVTRSIREPHIRVLLHSGIVNKEQLETALQFQRSEKKSIGEILVEHCMITKDTLDKAVKLQESEQKELEEILIEHGDISQDGIKIARILQEHEKRGLPSILVDLGYTDEESIYSCYALKLGMPYISLSQFSGNTEFAQLIPSALAYKYNVVPTDVIGQVLVIAASEPPTDMAKSEIASKTGYSVMAVCTSYREIEAALEQYCEIEQDYQAEQKPIKVMADDRKQEKPEKPVVPEAIDRKRRRVQEPTVGKTVEVGLAGTIRFQQTNDTIECFVKEVSQDCTEVVVSTVDPRIRAMEEIDLEIFLPLENSPVKCVGRIIWHSKEGKELFGSGNGYLARISILQISRIDKRRLDLVIDQKRAFISANYGPSRSL